MLAPNMLGLPMVLTDIYYLPHKTLMDIFYTFTVAGDSPLMVGYVSSKPR
jgi:hypothetical protein